MMNRPTNTIGMSPTILIIRLHDTCRYRLMMLILQLKIFIPLTNMLYIVHETV